MRRGRDLRPAHAALRRIGLALALHAGACATAPPPSASIASGFDRPAARRAAELAPDLYARAERAQQEALAARDPDVRADHAVRARLLLDAALAGADRIEDERAADRADERAERAAVERAALEDERAQVERLIAQEDAARSARAQAVAVFAGAAPSGSGSTGEGAPFVRDRARVLLASAIALGLPEPQAAKVEARIAQAEQARSEGAALAALALAERALGQARSARAPHVESAAPQACRALLEMARERGFAPELEPEGVTLSLQGAFAEGSATPSARGARLLSQLAALAAAHPLGVIEIEGFAEPRPAAGGSGKALEHIATARAERIARSLRDARAAADVRLAGPSARAAQLRAPLVVFTAYRARPVAQQQPAPLSSLP